MFSASAPMTLVRAAELGIDRFANDADKES
jgi:hypothetical protein